MTTSNQITLGHINDFFSLDADIQPLNVAPTATGGAGLIDYTEESFPVTSVPDWRESRTEYVKRVLDKDKILEERKHLGSINDSVLTINTIDDVEDYSTFHGSTVAINALDDEDTQNIYSTYFQNSSRIYDPDLAITSYREEILQLLEINPVVIIQGPTGCGKTTQVPQYILDYYQSKGSYCNIAVTQPRKIAAMSIARRVCQERKWQLGSIVGYQVAIDSRISSDTRLNYMTTGVLLEKLVNSKRMDMYTHVIIDEVHERNQEVDFALLLVKKFLKINSQRVKVILMSATFDSSEFAQYFSSPSHGNPAPVLEVMGKSKDVTEHYLLELKTLLKRIPEFDMSDPHIDSCLYDGVLNLMCVFDRIEKVEQRIPADKDYAPSRGAVLIFLPGLEEICELSNKLQAASVNKNFWIIPLHSSITMEEQTKVFRSAPPDMRKVILSTNIAESSITVPDVKYVIDFCLTKSLITDPMSNYTCLQLEWASKANCIQRKGRAGRVDIGKVYRMVPLQFYHRLPEYSIPEMKRCPLTKTILQVKKLNVCEPQDMLAYALDPPDLSDIGYAILQLKEALALTVKKNNPFDGDLTFIGRVMAHLPLDVKLSKLIIFGYVFHCLEECIIIAASLSLQSFFARPFQKTLDAYKSRRAWADNTFSDCLSYLNAYRTWKRLADQGHFHRPGGLPEPRWAKLNFIQLKRIKEVNLLVKDIKARLRRLNIHSDARFRFLNNEEPNIIILKMVIAGAFFPYYYIQESLDEKTVQRSINENDPLSTVSVSGLPPKHGILYATALKEMFACCSENISIEFEESRAYVRFLSNYVKNASLVHPAVYMAVKMRKLRIPLELSVFSPQEAERKTNQLLSSKSGPSNMLVSNRITVSEMSVLKRIQLPPLEMSITQIFITQVNNCGHFWARYVTSEITNLQNFLETTINKDKGRNLKHVTPHPKTNQLYLAPFSQNGQKSYYRVQIQELQLSEATVFFVDYGNAICIPISDLREIPESTPDVVKTPALAFECHLAEIKPSSCKSTSGNWSHQAIQWFKTEVSGQTLYAKIYSVIQGTVRMELIKQAHDGTILNINQQLIKLEFAEPAEESFASKQNHELRSNAKDYSSSSIISESSSRDLELSWNEAEDENIKKTGRTVKLHGPFNPLEVSYSGLTHLDRIKCTKVERDSVNSVSFNSEPQDSYYSMLIAASVGVGQNNMELILRNTTLLPKIRGLPTLICLLFTPYAEIRTNKDRTAYTGALCGLGFDPVTGESIYPDHDIELAFDIEITLDDIREINAIRMGFNLLLNSENDSLQYGTNPVSLIHENTRKTIIQLLQKKRAPKEPIYFTKSGRWNQILPELLLEASVENRADCIEVLPLHKPSSLASFELDSMSQHLKELYNMVDCGTSTDLQVIRCKLCSIDVTSTRELVKHLDSDKHQTKENFFRVGRKIKK
ncbi:ATP-dependent RNA helicase TDRD9 [Trichonephila clavata]|uniref:Probable ATP-dependent RNA helicase spindle-E n=1 Tax=Trichonephila clavata TaxID=2740835 RepID=A0A8X6LBL3_TRICU|nr:ATP-dependent RNA helicase TDRD9 [Trichonephila clavata]